MYVCMYVCMYIPLYVCIYFSLTKTLKFMYVQVQDAASVAKVPADIPVRRLQIVLPFLSYYFTLYCS